jgi:hypothetical protein
MFSYNIFTFILATKVLSAIAVATTIDDVYYTNANDYDASNYIDTHYLIASGIIGKKRRIPLSARDETRVYHSVHAPTISNTDAVHTDAVHTDAVHTDAVHTDAITSALVDLIDMKLNLALESFKNEIIEEQEQRMREIAKQSYEEFTSDSDSSDEED